jgi:phosphoribosylformylglycinamidine synthase subunit PurSL
VQVSHQNEIYRFVIQPVESGQTQTGGQSLVHNQVNACNDSRSRDLLVNAHSMGFGSITFLECHDLYLIEGQLNETALQRLATQLLSDPITQSAVWGRLTFVPGEAANQGNANEQHLPVNEILTAGWGGETFMVEVGLLPGVTDPVAEQIVQAARKLGIEGVHRVSTGFRYWIAGECLVKEIVEKLAQRLLANPTIQRYSLGEIEPVFPLEAEASGEVEILPVRQLDDPGLLALSHERRAALDLVEMRAIQAYFLREGRDPSDVEFETIAQTWSEHCVHKTFKALITDLDSGEVIDSLINTCLRAATGKIAAPWVRSAFVDNAGIIDFDDEYEISFKVETHNHPSAIEPFGGANTGVGGVIRDVLGVSARPIANTDVLCFGPQEMGNLPVDLSWLPEGVLHPRRIRSGVVAGVEDYGNKMGIPTVNGAIWYDPGFTANPLVFCGCVGIAPKDSHPRQPEPGDRVIVIGGRTGRDGLRGATFSSMTMDAQTGVVSGASVQIGNPITEKGVMEVILRLRDGGLAHPGETPKDRSNRQSTCLYHAITDCGAGGLSSAVGEMASKLGAEVDLKNVRLKYAGLSPWEIWLSEAQERMVLAVPEESVDTLSELCALFDVEWSDLGVFAASGRLVVRYRGKKVLDLENEFLHHGIPQRRLTARQPDPIQESIKYHQRFYEEKANTTILPSENKRMVFPSWNEWLLRLLAHPNIASKSDVIRRYDHEVQGGTVVKPLTGLQDNGPSDGCVLKPIHTQGYRGIALANGFNPNYGKLDAYHMAWSAVDESIRNAVATGADPGRIALLDNFCWGDPRRPETLGALVQAARGCHDAAIFYQAPFISGKDSLNNEYLGSDGQRHAIPPSLLISSLGILEDIRNAVTMDLKSPGNLIYLLGDFQPSLGGSHFIEAAESLFRTEPSVLSSLSEKQVLDVMQVPGKAPNAPAIYRAVHHAMQEGLIKACHDLSEGGLAVSAAEMCIGGSLGMQIELPAEILPLEINQPVWEHAGVLFGETNGCLLVEVRQENAASFEKWMVDLPFLKIGRVTAEPFMRAAKGGEETLNLPVNSLVSAWNPSHKETGVPL